MKKVILGLLLFFFSSLQLQAQLTVVSSNPADGSVGVTTTTTVSFTFNMPIDTGVVHFHEGNFLLTNLFSTVGHIGMDSISISADRKTVTITTPLKINKDYFLYIYGVVAEDGSKMSNPVLIRFTTSAFFSGSPVEGVVKANNVGDNSFAVFLTSTSFLHVDDTEPILQYCGIPDSTGNFRIENVQPGNYSLLAIRDVNKDGKLDFEEIDQLALADSITVTNSTVSGICFDFEKVRVISTYPQNNATNVPLNGKVEILLNTPIFSGVSFKEANYLITNTVNLDSLRDAVNFTNLGFKLAITPNLSANKDYFVLLYGISSKQNRRMEEPFLFRFTTASAFSGYSVSGKVWGDCCPVENSVVFLSTESVFESDGPPDFSYCGVADSNGDYTIPFVKPDVYYPLAVRDVDNDGKINFEEGIDAIGFTDSIIVANANVDSVNIRLIQVAPISFEKAREIADSIASHNVEFSGHSLKLVRGWDLRVNALPTYWEFIYYDPVDTSTIFLYIDNFGGGDMHTEHSDWVAHLKSIDAEVHQANNLDRFLDSVFTYDLSPVFDYQCGPNQVMENYVALGELGNEDFGDIVTPGQIYWGAYFSIKDTLQNWAPAKLIRFVGDYQTGEMLIVNDVKKQSEAIPENFTLSQNYPNPFNPTTKIRFSVPAANSFTHTSKPQVRLTVYNALGQRVAELLNKKLSAGTYEVTFNASNLPSGVYFYQLSAGNVVLTKKMVLLK